MSSNTQMVRREQQSPEKTSARTTVLPRVDIYENADEILVVADVPGVTKEDVNVRLDKDKLTVEASQRAPGDGQLTCEFPCVDYARSFLVPQAIDAESISADLQLGVLRVHLPKAAAAKPRQIPVKAG